MTYRKMIFVIASIFFAILAAPVVSADTNSIDIHNFAFSPNALAISAGTVVTWKNLDGEPHTVVSDQGLFHSDGLDQNDTFTYKFDKAGTYRFICSIHPMMRGTIVVK